MADTAKKGQKKEKLLIKKQLQYLFDIDFNWLMQNLFTQKIL